MESPSRYAQVLGIIRTILCFPGKLFSWLILPLMISVIVSVAVAMLGGATLIAWEGQLPVLGRALTVNSLLDMQWYFFALIVLFGGVWAFFEDRHVTVDFISIKLAPRTRAAINIFGDLFLLLPFCLLCVWYGFRFAEIAFRTGEGSIQGGLTAHWLIKGALPASFAFLGLAAIVRVADNIRWLRNNSFRNSEVHHDS